METNPEVYVSCRGYSWELTWIALIPLPEDRLNLGVFLCSAPWRDFI